MTSKFLPKGPARGFWIVAVVLAALPLVLPNNYAYDVAIRIAMNATVVIALNLLIGYTGQISIGHAGFFGLGAYASAILSGTYGWPPLAAMGAGLVLVCAIAFVAARPILKLKGHYLAMATLGLGIIISIAINNEAALTGGPDGLSVPALSLVGLEIVSELHWYVLCAAVLLLMLGMAQRIVSSPAGRALQAIDGSEIAAQVVGVDVARMKVAIFVFSAGVASVMGSLSAHHVGLVTPGVASFFHSVEFMTMVVVGGMASLYGSVVGAVLITLLPQLLSAFEGWETMVFGAILVLTVVFLPKGIVPTLRDRLQRRSA